MRRSISNIFSHPGLDAPCPLGPDGLPIAGCGFKFSQDTSVPESGTGIAGSTGTGYSLPGSTSTGFGGNKKGEKSIYGTVESDTNYGSVDTNYFSSNKYEETKYKNSVPVDLKPVDHP